MGENQSMSATRLDVGKTKDDANEPLADLRLKQEDELKKTTSICVSSKDPTFFEILFTEWKQEFLLSVSKHVILFRVYHMSPFYLVIKGFRFVRKSNVMFRSLVRFTSWVSHKSIQFGYFNSHQARRQHRAEVWVGATQRKKNWKRKTNHLRRSQVKAQKSQPR